MPLIFVEDVNGKEILYLLVCTGVTTTVLHEELHCDPANFPLFVLAELSLKVGLASSSSSLSVNEASAAVAEAAEVRLLAGVLSSRCARAKLSVDCAGGLVIMISSSSSECTLSLTIPDVVFDEVELITEIL